MGENNILCHSTKMPQLDTYTYSTQIFWMVLFFFLTYYYVLKVYLPSIITVIKLREKKIYMGKLVCASYDEELKVAAKKIIFSCSGVSSSKLLEFLPSILQFFEKLEDTFIFDWNTPKKIQHFFNSKKKMLIQNFFNSISLWYGINLVSSSNIELDNINESSLIFKNLK